MEILLIRAAAQIMIDCECRQLIGTLTGFNGSLMVCITNCPRRFAATFQGALLMWCHVLSAVGPYLKPGASLDTNTMQSK